MGALVTSNDALHEKLRFLQYGKYQLYMNKILLSTVENGRRLISVVLKQG